MAISRMAAFVLLLFTVHIQAGELVLSQDLKLQYSQPNLTSHSSNTLILKYDDWVVSHQLVDPKTVYARVDLSGIEEQYIKSLFLPEIRNTFPEWLQALSEEQARQFGLPENSMTQEQVGNAELIGTFSKKNGEGYLYIFDKTAIHHIRVIGSEKQYQQIIENIKER